MVFLSNHFRRLALSLGAVLLVHFTWAQDGSKLYLSFDSYINNAADYTVALVVEKRTQKQIFMSGGNDYKITPENNDRDLKRMLKKDCWAVEHRGALFINCLPQELGLWYAYARKANDLLFYSAALAMTPERQQELAMSSYVLGPLGGGLSSGQLALKRAYYTIDLQSGKSTYLSKDAFVEIMKPYPKLIEDYLKEKQPEEIHVLDTYVARYIELVQEQGEQ